MVRINKDKATKHVNAEPSAIALIDVKVLLYKT